MRLTFPFLLSQFGHLLVLAQDADSGLTEIDLIIPIPNSTYEIAPNHRFPIVWALRNPTPWKKTILIDWRVENTGYWPLFGQAEFSSSIADSNGTQYAAVDALLPPAGTYHLTWGVRSHYFECGETPKDKNITFSSKVGGQKTDLRSAVTTDCADWASVAYNIVNTSSACDLFDQDDPFPDPTPCNLKVEDAVLTNINKSMDTQYNKTCTDAYNNNLCPQPKEKNAASQLSMGVLAIGLPMMALLSYLS